MNLAPTPKKLPIILLIASGGLELTKNFLYYLVEAGREHIDFLSINTAENFVSGSLIYLLLCLAVMFFWLVKKGRWAKWAILSLVGIHLAGIAYFVVYFHELISYQGMNYVAYSG